MMSFTRTALFAVLGLIAGLSGPASAFIAAPALTGARLNAVAAGGPAQRSGLEVGDVIVAIDGQPIRSAYDFSRLTANKARVSLVVRDVRSGRFLQTEAYPRRGLIGVQFRIVALPEATIRDAIQAAPLGAGRNP